MKTSYSYWESNPRSSRWYNFIKWNRVFLHFVPTTNSSRKVADSIPSGVTGILSAALWPWGRPRLYNKWAPEIFPGGKGGRRIGLTALTPSWAECLEIWELQPPGTLRACLSLYRVCFTFTRGLNVWIFIVDFEFMERFSNILTYILYCNI